MDNTKLIELANHIDTLKSQAKHLDEQKGEHVSERFDRTLFKCNSRLLLPCVNELKQTLAELQHVVTQRGSQYESSVRYLSDRLINQMGAIQRELATLNLRQYEPKFQSKDYSLNGLYQQLAQHQDWERRLQLMLIDKQELLVESKSDKRQLIQQQILNVEQRLSRCQQSKNKIENQIAKRERKG
ncbi:primosomal replication protein [Vibrio sp.]|nr:primosomal replication protein [Vibrio sp.]